MYNELSLKKRVNLVIDEDDWDEFGKECAKNYTSRTAELRYFINQFIKQSKQQTKPLNITSDIHS